jgi:hypothetical protein
VSSFDIIDSGAAPERPPEPAEPPRLPPEIELRRREALIDTFAAEDEDEARAVHRIARLRHVRSILHTHLPEEFR